MFYEPKKERTLEATTLTILLEILRTSFGKAKAIWDGVAKRIEKRLVSWKKSYLSREIILLSSRVHYPIYLNIFCPFFFCQLV
jgi:hypothetical protein